MKYSDPELAWKAFLRWSERLSDRDISDAARQFAEAEASRGGLPENHGELLACIEIAFESGRKFERDFRTQENDLGR